MAKVQVHELRNKNKTELKKDLEELKTELSSLRVAQVTGGAASKIAKIRTVRKSIAQVHTVITARQREEIRKVFAKKTYLPKDIRTKKTRAIRRRLSKDDAAAKTLKQKKKDSHFAPRK